MKVCLYNIFRPVVIALAMAAGLNIFMPSAGAQIPLSPKDSLEIKKQDKRESIFPEKNLNLAKSHFTWGAEVGSSLDLTGHDMSTFDVDALFGYKNSAIRMLGFGVGIHRSIQHGDNFIPVYATIQTSFRSKPSLFFMSLKMGYSFNTFSDSPTFGDMVSSIGVGINLSNSRLVKTYVLLSAGYRYFNTRHIDLIDRITQHYIYIAQLRFGVSF